MKTKYNSILGVVVSSLVLFSCNDIETMDVMLGDEQMEFAAEYPVVQTRVTATSFENGDKMGVSVLLHDDNQVLSENACFTFDENADKWMGVSPLYWPVGEKTVDVIGCYPYSSDLKDLSSYQFSVDLKQDKDGGYEASDLLLAKTENQSKANGLVTLSYKHKMAGITVRLEQGNGFSEGEWNKVAKQVFVTNAATSCYVNLISGELTSVDGSTTITPMEWNGDFRAIVVPKTYVANSTLLSILVDGQEYKFKRNTETELVSGKMHSFTIKVDKRSDKGDYEFFVSESIHPWIDDEEFHDGMLRQYVVVNVPTPGTFMQTLESLGLKYNEIKSMKVTGRVNDDDVMLMGDMPALVNLNMKELDIESNSICEFAFDGAGITRLVLPDRIKEIKERAFRGCPIAGTLVFPEGIESIGLAAFNRTQSSAGNLMSVILPTTLKRIENEAFLGNGVGVVKGELLLPEGLEYVGDEAFAGSSLSGKLILPSTLKELGNYQVFGGSNFNGDLVIPEGVKEIPIGCFMYSHFDGRLVLPEGLIEIGPRAFEGCEINGELVLPSTLKQIQDNAFERNNFSNVVLPSGLSMLGKEVFMDCSNLSGEIVVPENISIIPAGVFMNCSKITSVKLPKNTKYIKSEAFGNDVGIKQIICDSPEPPILAQGAFGNLVKDNVTLQVPKEGINAYRQDKNWREFSKLTEYRDFVCFPANSCSLSEGVQTLVLNADAAWTLEHKPDWVTVYPSSGEKKTAITITYGNCPVGQSRVDSLVFKLNDDSNVRSYCHLTQYGYQYDEDQVVELQKHTKGNGISIYFAGDGWDARSIANGDYMNLCKQDMEYFFGLPPYDRLRDYFDVYAIMALSQETGVSSVSVSRDTRLGTYASYGTLHSDDEKVYEYIYTVTGHKNGQYYRDGDLWKDLIVIVPNTTEYVGETYLNVDVYGNIIDGASITLCPPSDKPYPNDTRGIIQHEAGGHGFGKLADEGIVFNAYLPNNNQKLIQYFQNVYGWYQNVAIVGKAANVPWSTFIYDSNYSNYVDIYEGSMGYTRLCWRSEAASCMGSTYIPYYNAISRYDITKRVMELSGLGFDSQRDFFSVDTNEWGRTGY